MTSLSFSWLEIIAVVASLASTFFSVHRSIWTWIFGIIGVIAYARIFWDINLYGDMTLQGVYFVQSVYGLYYWIYRKPEQAAYATANDILDETPAPASVASVSRISPDEFIWSVLGVSVLFGGTLGVLTQTGTASMPAVDALTTALSLVANALMARKILETWYLWIVVDSLLAFIFWYKNLYLSAANYAIFLIFAVWGWYSWRKQLLQNQPI